MKTKRKFMSILLALCMVFTLMPMTAFAAGTDDNKLPVVYAGICAGSSDNNTGADADHAVLTLDKALELIKKMENSEAEVATTHVNRALSLMALGRLDEADEELKESLTFYASPEGVQSGHFGSALAAAGELAWRRGNYDQAIGLLEKALMVTQSRFGESDACAVIRQNLEMIKKEKEEKGITGAADKKEDKGGNPSHCASCQFKDAKF